MGLFDDIVHGIEHAAEDVGKAIGHTIEDVGKAIAKAAATGGKVLGKVVDEIGKPVKYVVDGVAHALGDLVGIHMRSLTTKERAVLAGVFGKSLPLDRILITSIGGKDGRAFTIPGSMVPALAWVIPGVGPLITLGSLIEHLQDKYLINVGKTQFGAMLPSEYDGKAKERSGSLLVHEATHVWQGTHAAFSWQYVFNSLYFQIKCGSHAYDVDEKRLQTWNKYGVEQQAHLVENWYNRGSSITDVDYPFIRDNIRPGKPNAATSFSARASIISAKGSIPNRAIAGLKR